MKRVVVVRSFAAVFTVALAVGSAQAETGYQESDGVRVRAWPAGESELRIDVWPAPDLTVSTVRAEVGGVQIRPATPKPYPTDGAKTAVLLLVDTSDPVRRKRDIRRIKQHVEMLLKKPADHMHFGLARLASDLEVLAPLDTDLTKLRAAANKLTAKGATTELFRNTVAGIRLLAEADADRKAVILFSDGRQEDTAFTHEDVVKASRDAGIAVFTIGYSRTTDGTRWFQNLSRISESTGGSFLETDRRLNAPADFVGKIYGALDSGGRVTMDLTPVVDAGRGGAQNANVVIEIEGGHAVPFSFPVVLPPIDLIDRITAPVYRLYLVAAAVIVILGAGILIVVLVQRSRRLRATREAEEADAVPFAFLEFFDDSEKRHAVGSAAVRIGRNPDNDVQLNNTSVSAYHAEIQRRRDGTFIVTDLDSLNGVSINDETIDVGRLDDGDIVDLGEVRFRFKINPDRSH